MSIINHTHFPHLHHVNSDRLGREFDIIIVKSSFRFNQSFRLIEQKEQEPLNFTDHCFEDFNTSSLMYPSDLVPYKPKTDIIVIANTYPPGGNPLKQWNCGIRIDGERRLEKQLMVYGPRQWVPKWSRKLDGEEKQNWQKYRKSFKGWELSEPELTDYVPIRYEYAYGGMQERSNGDGEIEQIACEYNPIGTGWIDSELTDHTKPMRAPQLEAMDEPIIDPYKQYSPQSLGPIPPAWLPRRPLGGTYDQNWIDNIWPHWPPDYDFSYHNSAPIHLQYPGHMKGNERIQLLNLWPDKELIDINLCGNTLYAEHFTATQNTNYRMVLDTIYIDLTPSFLDDCLISLVWRFQFIPHETTALHIRSIYEDKNPPSSHQAVSPLEIFNQSNKGTQND